MRTCNDIRVESAKGLTIKTRNEHLYSWQIINNKVLELILRVLNEGTSILEEYFISVF